MSDNILKVVIAADANPLNVGLSIALNSLRAFGSQVEDIFGGIQNGIGDSIKRVSDQFAKSGNLSVTIGDYQKLSFAAQQTGTSMGTMDTALRRLEIGIGKATLGGKQANQVFTTLGLSAVSLAKMGGAQQIEVIGNALDGISNPAQRAAIAMQLFGRSGSMLLNFFQDLGQNSQKFNDIISPISEVDGAKIRNAGNSIKELGTILDNIYDKIASKISPVISNVISKLEDMGFTGKNIGKYIDDSMASVENFAAETIAISIAMKETISANWANTFGRVGGYLNSFIQDFKFGWAIISDIGASVWNGLVDGAVFMANAVSKIVTTMVNVIGFSFNLMGNVVGDLFSKLLNPIIDNINKITSGINSISGSSIPQIGGHFQGRNSVYTPYEAQKFTREDVSFGGTQDLWKVAGAGKDIFNQEVGKSFKDNLNDARDSIKGLFHGDAEKKAIEDAAKRKDNRDNLNPLLPSMDKGVPLGFAEDVGQYGGGNAAVNAIGLQRASQRVNTMEVSDQGVQKAVEDVGNKIDNLEPKAT